MERSSTAYPAAPPQWPPLPLAAWSETYRTLHMWAQMVGKVRLALTPLINHWWNVTLYVNARGLTTAPMAYGARDLEISFDFVDHVLRIDVSSGDRRELALAPLTVAQFYRHLMMALDALGVPVKIWPMPVEIPNPIRFTDDHAGAYDAEYAQRWWRIVSQVHAISQEFRARFIGKCSPVHFFWGSFDIAVTRFSGRRAPARPGADFMTQEAYSHEVSSVGFWPGSGPIAAPAFYAYAAPEPDGMRNAAIRPATAFYHAELGEFIYRYDDMRAAADPRAALLEFMQSTYDAAADFASWDRNALERGKSC